MGSNEKPESKFSCKECNVSFKSDEQLNLHLRNHSEVYCESCPIDMTVREIKKLFARKNKK